jgi:hypothetical protein
LVERNAGPVRGFELDLVADGGEGCARSETEEKGEEEGNTERDAAGCMMYGGVHHRVTSHWRTL